MSTKPGFPSCTGCLRGQRWVLATAIGAVAAHSATAYWDQAYAEPRRRVTPVEQHVHSLLEVSPIMATFLITALTGTRQRHSLAKTVHRALG